MAKPRFDWAGIAVMLEENEGQWICPLPNEPRATASTVRRRDIPALKSLRETGTLESMSRNSYVDDNGKERADIYIRWTRRGRTLSTERPASRRKKGDPRRIRSKQRTIQVPARIADRVDEVTSAAGVSISAYMTELMNTILDEGTDFEGDHRGMRTLNFEISPERWTEAKFLAAEKGSSLRAIIMHELNKRFGGQTPTKKGD